MQRGKTGHGGPERTGPDELNAARVRLLIADALGQLSAEHRAVIARSYYLRWTTAQIADDLDIAEWFVKSRLHVALRALRLALERHREVVHASRPPDSRFRRHGPHASRR
jgi:DNA-directed RNA polymerase specialized sigma24 family protein